MALRREKDIISRNIDDFLTATTDSYAKYFQGSPTYITYYQLNSLATQQDSSLENVHSLIGSNTPNKYKKIDDVVVYGVDVLDISNEIGEQGLKSTAGGEFVFLPDSIRPYPGDFFVFDYEGLKDHLFRIDDVQYDRANAKKYFKVQFAIYQDNADLIFNNIENDYTMVYETNSDGTTTTVVTSTEAQSSETTKLLVDSLIKEYQTLFYDEDMDTFVYEGESAKWWCPYLQKFIHDNNLMVRYKKELMTEIWVDDYFGKGKNITYNDLSYKKSLFRKIEKQDTNYTLNDGLLLESEYNLKSDRSLPFFSVTDDYKLITVVDEKENNKQEKLAGAFSFIYEEPEDYLLKKLSEHNIRVFSTTEELEAVQDQLVEGDILYQVSSSNPTTIINMYRVEVMNDGNNTADYLGMKLISFPSFMTANVTGESIINILQSYMAGTFKITEAINTEINDIAFEITCKNYILIPILIYILKQTISDSAGSSVSAS